ncbi:MAG TPA: hypothetical protein VKU01_22765 [Bryobacteraceae bacterium]|nr:hypothetical protein [Bryobacteraceae bacterium]
MKSAANDLRNRETERCRAEIAAIEALLLAGHPDIEDLCLGLADWYAEWGILEGVEAEPPPDPLNPAAME